MNVISLGAWLDVCREAHVPYVEAKKVASISKDILLGAEETWGDNEPEEVGHFKKDMKEARLPNTMFRWDCCAPFDVKAELSKGFSGWNPVFGEPLYPV